MGEQDVIDSALSLTSGARFVKCALQVNPYHYQHTYRGQPSGGDSPRGSDSPSGGDQPSEEAATAAEFAEAVVEKAADLGVGVLAITDHNSIADVPHFQKAAEKLQEAAENSKVAILPGFELESTEGIHVLCIYDADTELEYLKHCLGEFSALDTSPSSRLCGKSFADILGMVREQGGVTIAAHVTSKKGLLIALQGQARIKAWKNPNLLAVQIPGSIEQLDDSIRRILANKDANYKRAHPAGERQAVAAINCMDITKADDLNCEAATCWVKTSDRQSVEGLRQAFLDPGSRIRLNSDHEPDKHADLVAIAWEGGFLDGVKLHFNQNLNVLIGGRGVGKSTVIESLRYVLNISPVSKEASAAHRSIVDQVLRDGTRISLLVRSHDPNPREYRIERTVRNPSQVRSADGSPLQSADGTVLSLLPSDVFPEVEVYGQHEIAQLSRDPSRLTTLLDRFVKHEENLERQEASARQGLKKTRESILATLSELKQIDEQLERLPSLEESLDRYEEVGLGERLRERRLLVREERIVESLSERLGVLRELVSGLREEVPVDRVFLSDRALRGLPGRNILKEADEVLEKLGDRLAERLDLIEADLGQADERMGEIRSRWEAHKLKIEREYEQSLRDLKEVAIDGGAFIRVEKEIERLQPLRDRREFLIRALEDNKTRRKNLLVEWERLQHRAYYRLSRAAKDVNARAEKRIQVSVTQCGDQEPLHRLLRKDVGGRLRETFDQLERQRALSPSEFADRCRRGSNELLEHYQIPPGQAERLSQASEDTLMRLEELLVPSTTTLKLNVATPEKPSWRTLELLSLGQKATAILLLLLLESDAPLIIDQPEDDLDNRFITETIIPRMRCQKFKRQLVVSTHNANIPVLGDAELILGLSAESEDGEGDGNENQLGRAFVASEHRGSIDNSSIQELVAEVMEGGKAAFESRRLKYGF